MNIRQLPWYQDKKTQQAELHNNKNAQKIYIQIKELNIIGYHSKCCLQL